MTTSVRAFQRNRQTWALYLVLGLFAYLETTIGPAMPFIRDRLDLSYTVASLHFAAFAAGAIVAGLSGDRVVRRFGRRPTLWWGMTGMAGGVALIAVSPVLATSILGALMAGGIGTLALMANQSSLADLHPDHRTTALAESNVAASSAAVMAPLAVGRLAETGLGWQTALLLGLPVLAVLVARFASVPLPNPAPVPEQLTSNAPLPRQFALYAMVLFLASAVEWIIAFWGADFLDSVVGLNGGSAATAMSVFFAAMIAGRAIGARLTRRRAGSQLLMGAFLIALAGFPFFWLAGNPFVSLAGLFVAGIGIANFYPLTIGVATSVAGDRPDRATARLAVAGGLSVLTAPLVVGVIADLVGIRWGFGVVVLLLAAALVTTRTAAQLQP